ncbi:hypothetical protein CLV51_108105 [Chitinophaga niastensis]|uniref:Uncharacterized protein n=1 Tax=Chitinophaga niastensis TaxID=536980 RepID=A0A2P8HB05_CHINA|nr:hypothetical protein CLV51_108105 [Chitinophaga niastensis]
MTISPIWNHLIPQTTHSKRVCINCGSNPYRTAKAPAANDYVYRPFREMPMRFYQVPKLYPWLDIDRLEEDELRQICDLLVTRPGKGDLNKRTFTRFMRYHHVPVIAAYGTNRIYLHDGRSIRDPNSETRLLAPTSISFSDDGYASIMPVGVRYSVNLLFVESRVFYRKLARYTQLPRLEVTERL